MTISTVPPPRPRNCQSRPREAGAASGGVGVARPPNVPNNAYTLNPIADGEVEHLKRWYSERYPRMPGAMGDSRRRAKLEAPGPKSTSHADAHGPMAEEVAAEAEQEHVSSQ